jgi:hypothetical protein
MNRSYSKIRHIQEANARLEKRVLSEQINKTDDQGLLNKACTTWSSFKKTSSPEEIKQYEEWTKQYTKGSPFSMDVACKSKANVSISSDNDRKILNGVINLSWLK